MTRDNDDTDLLLARIADGQGSAVNVLLERHRRRLAAMVRLRMDRRVAARFDPSDVVQDTMIEAYRKLPKFAQTRPIPFYPWLRSMAWERLVQLHRRHVHAARRSVNREEWCCELPAGSEAQLAERFVKSATKASGVVIRAELRERVRAAIEELPAAVQEVVVLRHLEDLPFREISAVLGISEDAVYSRYRRAVERLARLLKDST
jgi:RNA polymerase sigma-70 factor (ECF subfamily)